MRIFVLMVGLGLAAGCSGSNSGGSNTDGAPGITRSDADFENARTLAPNEKFSTSEGSVRLTDGSAVESTIGSDSVIGAFSETEGEVQIVISEDQEAVRIITSEGVIQLDDVVRREEFYIGLVEETDADGTQAIRFNPNESDEFDYLVVAGWGESFRVNGELQPGKDVNFGVSGNPTPADEMPTGSATYSGVSLGSASTESAQGLTTSDISITTPDYSSITIESSNTRLENFDENAAPGLDYVANGTVSGNGFSASGDGVNVNGDFFGPGAAEAGGSFSGTRTYKGETATYGGAFGARKAN